MQAIILAGGKGERLRPFTEDRPKAMVEILGVPLLGYQLQWLQSQGVDDVIVACGYQHQVIEDFFGTGEKWSVSLRYEVENEPLGRGGALKRAFGHLRAGEDVCLATNGDVLTNVRIKPLVQAHRASGCPATVVLAPFISPYGIVDVDADDRITAFQEKPELPYWMNAGIYVFNRDVETLLPDQGDLEDSTFPQLAKERRLAAFKSRAYWRSVDTVKDLSEVTKELEKRLLTSFLA
ncbi:MAG TPA: nucleotidyltransferase family protein [bacterium]|jgi:NDP-sugar pyrophosphorylase family protein|nr:nucleotidyltransferase family protein [bacterium]